MPYRETPFTGKVTANLSPNQFLSVRYGRDTNSQPYNAAPNSTFDNWGDSTNKYNSINLNHNWVLGGSKLNEFIFQFADFGNTIASRTSDPEPELPERRDHRRQRQHAADDRSSASSSSATTSRGTRAAAAASATTSRSA